MFLCFLTVPLLHIQYAHHFAVTLRRCAVTAAIYSWHWAHCSEESTLEFNLKWLSSIILHASLVSLQKNPCDADRWMVCRYSVDRLYAFCAVVIVSSPTFSCASTTVVRSTVYTYRRLFNITNICILPTMYHWFCLILKIHTCSVLNITHNPCSCFTYRFYIVTNHCTIIIFTPTCFG
jgi:hypothetical protein